MNKEEMKAKMDELSVKMKDLEEKTKDGIDTAKIAGMYAKDKIDEMVAETKSSINAMKENYVIYSERLKGKASSELLRAQMNIDVAKEKIEEKKEAHDKESMEKNIEELTEYATACIELSKFAAAQARLAALEIISAEKEYEEKYGNE